MQSIATIKNKAFTLAEVLITLGVIGIIAALTIPTLISEYQEKAYLEQFKKAYTSLFNAYKLAIVENGAVNTWTSSTEIYDYLKPQFKLAQDCPIGIDGCFATTSYTVFSNSNTKNSLSYLGAGHNQFLTTSGISIAIFLSGTTPEIFIDTNGPKGPNRWGYDFFLLTLTTKNNVPILSVPSYGTSRNSCSKPFSGGWYDGGSCDYWIIKHWNMDYLHREITATEW